MQIAAIAERIVARGHSLLVTRADQAAFDAVRHTVPAAQFHPEARAITFRQNELAPGKGVVLVAAAGTSDIPVAEEAAVTADLMGNTVDRLYDVGVAGLHRLLGEQARLAAARVVIVVAGMEGALPSVIGGLVGVPVIAVPTSIGYGASFGASRRCWACSTAARPGSPWSTSTTVWRRRGRQPDQPLERGRGPRA
jgi:NCAIR mutase (PurE)-related protein